MKLEINTITKTLRVLERISIEELISYVKEHKMEDWTIESQPIQYTFIPYVQPLDPYTPPFYITRTTYETHTT